MVSKPNPVEIIPVDVLLGAYANGYFPMSESGKETVQWYYSDPAAIIFPFSYSIPRSLKQFIKRCPWTFSADTAFGEVIRRCADREETWISRIIIRSYEALHTAGHAHSIEIREKGKLIGGLYGVSLGAAFFGESMFHTKTNASKVALALLLAVLRENEFSLLDIQMMTSVMEQFGATSVGRKRYLDILKDTLTITRTFSPPETFVIADSVLI
jgi:leucyl/phenylalanyl-tRNA---protein transferase